jgi:hypothetical protein
MNKPSFGCVYKTGGDYTAEDVRVLLNQVARNTSYPFNFYCYTDDIDGVNATLDFSLGDIHICRLTMDYPGWWSFPELFRNSGPMVACGLDSIIVGSINLLFEISMGAKDDEFYMVRAFNRKKDFASCIMAWNGDFSDVFTQFNFSAHTAIFRGEQDYTIWKLKRMGVKLKVINDLYGGIYSYKHHCQRRLPENARFVLFHGHPRPSEVMHIPWVNRSRR